MIQNIYLATRSLLMNFDTSQDAVFKISKQSIGENAKPLHCIVSFCAL